MQPITFGRTMMQPHDWLSMRRTNGGTTSRFGWRDRIRSIIPVTVRRTRVAARSTARPLSSAARWSSRPRGMAPNATRRQSFQTLLSNMAATSPRLPSIGCR
jgi:hypothetical protein